MNGAELSRTARSLVTVCITDGNNLNPGHRCPAMQVELAEIAGADDGNAFDQARLCIHAATVRGTVVPRCDSTDSVTWAVPL
jgi:hypothetical protein